MWTERTVFFLIHSQKQVTRPPFAPPPPLPPPSPPSGKSGYIIAPQCVAETDVTAVQQAARHSAASRLLVRPESFLWDVTCEFARCNQGTNFPAPRESRCTCVPAVLSPCELSRGEFVQVAADQWNAEQPTIFPLFTPCKVTFISLDEKRLTVAAAQVNRTEPTSAIRGDARCEPVSDAVIHGDPFTRVLSDGWSITVVGAPESSDVHLYKYGFVPDASLVATDPAVSYVFGSVGVYKQQMFDMSCMSKVCRLSYDAAEHGVFRYSRTCAFSIDVMSEFERLKSSG